MAGETRPSRPHAADETQAAHTRPLGDDTRPVGARRRARPRRGALWFGVLGLLVVAFFAVSAGSGYLIGLDERRYAQSQAVADVAKRQFDTAVEDLVAGRYELARQRFEYVLSLDPDYPGAADFLAQALAAMNQPTVTPSPIASPTATITPDLSSLDGLLTSANAAFAAGDWSGALDLLILIRGEDPQFQIAEVNRLMAAALRNRGMDKLFQGDIEEGIYDLNLAERFGPLDNQAASWRRSAEFYMFANSYFGLDWALAADYFGQICVADIWGACAKYGVAAREYALLLLEEDDPCKTAFYFDQAFTYGAGDDLGPTATAVGAVCMTATAPTPTPTESATPGLESSTPTATLAGGTPTATLPGATATPSPTATLTPIGDTPTPSDTPSPTATPTPSPTETPTPTETPIP